jgi:hypothetical protein
MEAVKVSPVLTEIPKLKLEKELTNKKVGNDHRII